MKFLVIGLGIYGSNLAINLTDMGHEVVGVDIKSSNVENVKDYISTAYIMDASDEQALSVLPLKSVDAVIVAIGENFGASVKTVALLKKMGIQHIFARAIDTLHQSILEGLDVERILTPEQRAAKDLARELKLGSHIETLSITDDSYVMKFQAPEYFVGLRYAELDIVKRFNLILIVATRCERSCNMLGLSREIDRTIDITAHDAEVKSGDIFTCYGTDYDFKSMMKKIARY
ncbi:MAG: TrkA family potassium uptake protein [Muribaculaceae bacterium]|nr:TrkA family potassium uptake protein [Muribaculaceae bacterium]